MAQEASPLRDALALLPGVLDPQRIEDWQPSGDNAVYTASVVVWMLVYQRLHPAASLENAVARFLEQVGAVSTNKRVRDGTLSADTSTYSRARSRLRLAIAEKSADHVFTTLAAKFASDRRTFVLDGTTLSLPSHPALRREFPPASNQHGQSPWPVAHLVLADDLDTGLMVRPEIGAMFGPNADSELALALRLLPRIPPKSLLMADRNFGVFGFAWHAVQAGHDVLTRLTVTRFRSMAKTAEPLDPGRWKFRWTPTRDNRKTHPDLPADAAVDAHLYEFTGKNGQTLWVVATAEMPVAEVADRYYRRWEIETDLRSWKQTLQCDGLRGHSAEMVKKEVAMAALAYNLVVEVRRLAAERAKVPPKRISFAGVWSLVTTILFSGRPRTAEEWERDFERVLRGAGQRKLPDRPDRHYPRRVLVRRRRFPERSANPKEPGK